MSNKQLKKFHSKVSKDYKKICNSLKKNPFTYSVEGGDEHRRLLNYGYVPGSEQ